MALTGAPGARAGLAGGLSHDRQHRPDRPAGRHAPPRARDRRAEAARRHAGARTPTDGRGEHRMGSMSIWHWLIVLVVVVLIFGTKKLRNIGQDLGGAVKGFKDGVKSARGGRERGEGSRRAAAADRRHDDRRRGQEGADASRVEARVRGRRVAGARVRRPARARHVRHRLLARSSSSPSWRWSCSAPRSCRRRRARSAICSAGCSATSHDVKADINRETRARGAEEAAGRSEVRSDATSRPR